MNIAIIIIDTLRYDYVGANGNPGIHTPNLDKLAARSWNFDRAFAASFPTIPHRTDTITGRYGAPFHSWRPLNCDVRTIPAALSDLGYCTQLIHDTPHLVNGGHCFDFPFHAWMPVRGAEVDRAWIMDSWKYPDNWCADKLFEPFPGDLEALRRSWIGLSSYMHTNRNRDKEEDWNVARLFLTASDFLKDNTSRDNFFLWVDCFDPHEPWDSPPEFVRMYDRTPGYDGRIDPRSFPQQVKNSPNLSEAAIERIKAMYAAKVTFMDKWLGVFLNTLEETGLAKNTAILLTSDHGTNVGDREGNRFGKTIPPLENEAHVPLILHVPGSGSGRCDAIVQPQDVFATVMSLAGGTIPDTIESYDVLKIAREGGSGQRKLALTGMAVRGWRDPDRILFSALNRDWSLGFAANPEKCELKRLGSQADVAAENPDIVRELHGAAIEEIAHRGLDPTLVEWLKSHGKTECPRRYRLTDTHSPPLGWRTYWDNHYTGK